MESKEEREYSRLLEELTLERCIEEALPPPHGGWHGFWNLHYPARYFWRPSRSVNKFDILYRNKEGKLHRLYGPAYISQVYELEIWYKDGEYHREDGPAVQHGRNCFWFKEGKLHRLDGPAVVELCGPKQYWIDGVRLPPKEYKKEIKRRRKRGLIK